MKPTLLFILLLVSSPSYGDVQLDSSLAKITDKCSVKNPQKHVWIFKQWHLSPSVDTKNKKPSSIPQEKNQTSIFKQIDTWVKAKKMPLVLAEGCEGEIKKGFSTPFNGWTLETLSKRSKDKSFDQIVTMVPLKLEARHGGKLVTYCGDKKSIIKKHQLAFSDARAAIGYYSRIDSKSRRSQQAFLKSAINAYQWPKNTTASAALVKLKDEVKKSIKEFLDLIHERNKSFVEAIKARSETQGALIIGGVHAADLKSQLEAQKIGCTIVEPVGYEDNEVKLVESLRKFIKSK